MWQKLFSIPLGTALNGKNSLPLGANFFLQEKFPFREDTHCFIQ